LETLLVKKPDLHKVKNVERQLIQQLHPETLPKERRSPLKKKVI